MRQDLIPVNLLVFNTRLNYLQAGTQYGNYLFGYFAIAPFSSFYSDNQNLSLFNYGSRIETGLAKYLSVGLTYSRFNFNYLVDQKYLTSFLGNIALNIDNFFASAGLGQTKSISSSQNNILQIITRYERKMILDLVFRMKRMMPE